MVKTEYAAQISNFFGRHDIEGVLIVDENGIILSANDAAESLLGYGDGQLTNLFLSDIWKGAFKTPKASPERSRPQQAELIRHDGETLPVSITVSPINGSTQNENLASFVGRAELDRLDESLMHVQRLAGIGTMTVSVAHELTNPISIITATCTNLVDGLNDDTVNRNDLIQAIRLIEQNAFRCAHIAEVLRNYAYPASQDAPDGAAVAITSPAAIVGDALSMVEQQFRQQARVTVATDLQPDLTTVFCDHHRIAQVLINLLMNARDAMQPTGGVVRVRAWVPDPVSEPILFDRIRSSMKSAVDGTEPLANLFAFSVTDTGTGIAPEMMERLFEPFFTTKPTGQGAGLGLFIARGIVDRHGGCIYAANNPFGGATFTVVLPRKQR